jgi:hypothetical protein
MISALLKGESLTAFKTALEDVCMDPDPNIQALLPLTLEHIIDSMDQVAEAVFPHRSRNPKAMDESRHEETNGHVDLQNGSGNYKN